jgi:hypothetical protein
MALSRDMSAEIYAAGEATQTLSALFSSADDLGPAIRRYIYNK